MIVLAALGFVGLAAAIALYAFAGGSATPAADLLRNAGCTFNTYPAQSRRHITAPLKNFKYNSFPPTSGPHDPTQPPFTVYDEPVEQYRLIHNLEHGGVVIQYGNRVPPATVDAIIDWYRDDPNGLVIAPLPALRNQIALAAWNADLTDGGGEEDPGRGILARCTAFDEDAFSAFVDQYGFKGPERFPKDLLTPGT